MIVRFLLAVGILAGASGCGLDRPADAVALSLYARNRSAQAFAFTVVGSHSPAVLGEAGTDEPRSYGCGWVGADWQLIVAEGLEPPEPFEDFAASRSGADYGNPDRLALSIDVTPGGGVVIGEGVPAWWEHEEQICP